MRLAISICGAALTGLLAMMLSSASPGRVFGQSVAPANWHKVDAGPFSILAPSGWDFHQLEGVDSFVGEFVGDGIILRFDFGGYSLLTMKLFSRINCALGVKLPISLLFDAPTVRKLAKVVADGDSPSIIVPIRPRGQAAPLFVVHSYLLYGALPDAIEPGRPIYGIREVHRDEKMQTVQERASYTFRKSLACIPMALCIWQAGVQQAH